MKLLEIVYAIREKLNVYTDDSRYTDDYLHYLINLKRNLLLRREYNQLQRTIDDDLLTTICLELEFVNPSECPECSISEDCDILRSVDKLPKYIELHNRSTITRIAPIGITNRPINLVSRNRITYIGEGRTEKNQVYAFIHDNGHLYLKSKNPFFNTWEYVTVTGMVENPMEIIDYSCDTEGTQCYDPIIDRYPVKAWMTDVIINTITEELANLKQVPEDVTNNAKEDV